MMILVGLVSFASGVLVGAAALHWIRARVRRERSPAYAGIIDHETGDSAFAHPFRRDLEGR